jgi:calcineurin-like phosphoesterase family protein
MDVKSQSALTTILALVLVTPVLAQPAEESIFRVWAAGDSHVPSDIRHRRESLAKAIRQSEGREEGTPGFDWDIMIDVGDLSASQFPPTDEDGEILVKQYRTLKKHLREDVYNVPGNHDGVYYDQDPGSWFRKWADPFGENTEFSEVDASRRPYPIEGNWERYKFQAGNILFLMLSDRNSAPAPVGRGHSSQKLKGGFPAGAVTRETFNWWKQQVEENPDKILITACHHVLRDTTTRSGYGGGRGFHGSSGGVEGSGYLYFTIENEDPDNFKYTVSEPGSPGPFEVFLDEFHKKYGRPAIDLWIGGHSHSMDPMQVYEERDLVEQRWGVTFLQASGLTKHHGGGAPMSRLLTFRPEEDYLQIDLYLHEPYKPENHPVGWHEKAAKQIKLRHPFTNQP